MDRCLSPGHGLAGNAAAAAGEEEWVKCCAAKFVIDKEMHSEVQRVRCCHDVRRG